MTIPLPEIARRLVGLFDAIHEPVSVASAIRDREGRILDYSGGVYDMRAIWLGDGYFSPWRRRSPSPEPA